jgi:hypothetical protein
MATMAVRVTGAVIGAGIAVGTTTTEGVGEQRRLVVIYYWYPASDVIVTGVGSTRFRRNPQFVGAIAQRIAPTRHAQIGGIRLAIPPYGLTAVVDLRTAPL